METLGRLAGGVAHDFNNLMTVVLGQVEMLSGQISDPQILKGLAAIGYAGERATAITRQLLAFGRQQVLQPKRLDLNATVEKMELMLRRLIGDNIVVSTYLQPGLNPIRVDPTQIEQIILNLAVNARDSMSKGGRLIFETGTVEIDDAFSKTHIDVLPGPYLLLRVTDTGCGMDSATQSQIFEPFFTTKEQGKGTGLGLATVYGIVKQSGGHIEVISEVGHGTTFKIYLPQAASAANISGLAPSVSVINPLLSSQLAGKPTAKILVVDDEEILLEIIREMLEFHGYTVFTTTDCQAAREHLRRPDVTIDVLISDILMPYEDGPTLAAALTKIQPNLKVLFMSAYSIAAIEKDGILTPGASFIEKPFRMNDLVEAVLKLLKY